MDEDLISGVHLSIPGGVPNSDPAVATVPASVRVPAGAISVGFTITTTAGLSDTITGNDGAIQTATLIVVP